MYLGRVPCFLFCFLFKHPFPVGHLVPAAAACVVAHVCFLCNFSLLHMLRWHHVVEQCVCQRSHAAIVPTPPPHTHTHTQTTTTTSSPPSRNQTLVLSASALRSRCGISQRTRLQSDQLFKLQFSASGEPYVYLFFCLHIFRPRIQRSGKQCLKTNKQTQQTRVLQASRGVTVWTSVHVCHKGHSFSSW